MSAWSTKNVFNRPLKVCGLQPLTGYNRTGYCTYDPTDPGTHIVCAYVTDEFLQFTLSKGNDLITPRGSFPGLKPGDRWCLCVLRWIEAYEAGAAPFIDGQSTHQDVLKYVPYYILKQYMI